MVFMKTKIILLALTIGGFFCFSCHTSNERPTICGRLVQVYYNYLPNKKTDIKSKEIVCVFRIYNRTNDSIFLPIESLGFYCNSSICVLCKNDSFSTWTEVYNATANHIVPPHETVICSLTIKDFQIPLNNNVRKVLPTLKFEYVVDETERAKSKYSIPDIKFVYHEKDVKYIYDPGNKGDGPV